MTLDKRISLSAILQILGMLGVATALWAGLEKKSTAQETRANYIELRLKDHEVYEDKRLERMEDKVDRILDRLEKR